MVWDQTVVSRVRVVELMWKEEVVWSVFVGVQFGFVFGLVFVEVREVLVWSGFVVVVLVKVVEVVGSERRVQKAVQKKQERVESSCTLKETQAS